MAYFSPLKPRYPHLRNPVSLQELAAAAVPKPGETARTFLPPCHGYGSQTAGRTRIPSHEAEFQKEHAKNFRYVLKRYHRM